MIYPSQSNAVSAWNRWVPYGQLMNLMIAEENWVQSFIPLKEAFEEVSQPVGRKRLMSRESFIDWCDGVTTSVDDCVNILFPLIDRDGDDHISLPEFVIGIFCCFLYGSYEGPQASAWQRARRQLLFTYYDIDGNGFLTSADWNRLITDSISEWFPTAGPVGDLDAFLASMASSKAVRAACGATLSSCFAVRDVSPTADPSALANQMSRLLSYPGGTAGVVTFDAFDEAFERNLLRDLNNKLRWRVDVVSSRRENPILALATKAGLTLGKKAGQVLLASGASIVSALAAPFLATPDEHFPHLSDPRFAPPLERDRFCLTAPGECGREDFRGADECEEVECRGVPKMDKELTTTADGSLIPPDSNAAGKDILKSCELAPGGGLAPTPRQAECCESTSMNRRGMPDGEQQAPQSDSQPCPALSPGTHTMSPVPLERITLNPIRQSGVKGPLIPTNTVCVPFESTPKHSQCNQTKPECRLAQQLPKAAEVSQRGLCATGEEPNPKNVPSGSPNVICLEASPKRFKAPSGVTSPMSLIPDVSTLQNTDVRTKIVTLYLRYCVGFVHGQTDNLPTPRVFKDLLALVEIIVLYFQQEPLFVDLEHGPLGKDPKRHIRDKVHLIGPLDGSLDNTKTALTQMFGAERVASTKAFSLGPSESVIFSGNVLGPQGLVQPIEELARVLLAVWGLKAMFPERVFFVRGPNEFRLPQSPISVRTVDTEEHGDKLMALIGNSIMEVVDEIPLAICVDKLLWVYGGELTRGIMLLKVPLGGLPKPELPPDANDPTFKLIRASFDGTDKLEIDDVDQLTSQLPSILIIAQSFLGARKTRKLLPLHQRIDLGRFKVVLNRATTLTVEKLMDSGPDSDSERRSQDA